MGGIESTALYCRSVVLLINCSEFLLRSSGQLRQNLVFANLAHVATKRTHEFRMCIFSVVKSFIVQFILMFKRLPEKIISNMSMFERDRRQSRGIEHL